METKCREQKINFIKHRIGFPNAFFVNPVGSKGGLVMFWRYDDLVEVVNYSNYYIHVNILDTNLKTHWFLTGFYGIPETHKRTDSWELLS